MTGDGATAKKLVLITGAAGGVGSFLRPYLRRDYRLRLHYRQNPLKELAEGEEAIQADIEDFPAVERIVRGVDAIVHLAGEPSPGASWEGVRGANIDGTHNVFEAARRAGVPKIVFATTNHVMGMYDRDRAWPIHPDQPIRPDSYYGVSKAFGEALARYYVDDFGLAIICLRIGWVLERPHNEAALRMWLSPRDLAQLVGLSIETPVRFGLYYGVSANTRLKWNIANVRRDLGYAPVDDSEAFAAAALGADTGS